MSVFDKVSKWLTGSANRASKTQQKRKSKSVKQTPKNSNTSHKKNSNANRNATKNAYVNRVSGGASSRSGSSGSGRTSNRPNKAGAGSQTQQTRQQKKSQNTWQAYVNKNVNSNKSRAAAQKAYQKGKNINALGTKVKTRTSGNLKSKDLTRDEYLKLQNASRLGKDMGNKALGKELAEKVGSRTAYSANKNRVSRAATGAMQGLAFGDVLEGGVGTYNKQARKELEKAKKSTAFNVGYGAGQVGSFALGGTSSAAKALVSGGAKAGAKAAAKSGGKAAAKKFAKNRAAEVAVETPLNALDAVKMSRDENGEIDKKKLAGYMALNTGLTAGAGGAIEGAGMAFTRKNADRLLKLQAKANKGSISKEEGRELKKLYDKLGNARKDTTTAKSDIADEAYREGKNLRLQGKVENSKARKAAKAEGAAKVERRNDEELLRGNEDVIENGRFIDARNETVPETTTLPDGVKPNKNQAKSSRKSARENLAGKYSATPKAFSKEESKEINDTIDTISNMLANGNEADARAEARALAEKHGNVDDFYTNEDSELWDAVKGVQDYTKGITIHTPEGSGSLKEIKEHITGDNYNWRNLHIRKSKNGSTKSVGLDQVRDELAQLYPGLFREDMEENEVLRKLAEYSSMKKGDTNIYSRLPDEDVEAIYNDLANDIFEDARANVDKMKGNLPSQRTAAQVFEDASTTKPSAEPSQEAKKALDGSKKYKEYTEKPEVEQIRERAPSFEQLKKQSDAGEMSGYETSKHLETIYDAGHYEPKEIRAQLERDLKAGAYVKANRESHAAAIERAKKSVDSNWREAYNRQIGKSEAEDITAFDYAERKYVMEKLEDMVRNGEGDVDELVKLHRDLSINEVLTASNTGAALNAAKIMKRMTPAGRAQLMLKKVDKLNEKFGDRLKGEKLELTDEQYNRIIKAESEEEAAKVLDEISEELMEQIPSTVFEKLNEIRRFTMLANLRTHERNIIGNTVFAGARSLSDAMEVAAYKLPAVRNRVEKLGGVTEMNKLSYRNMVKENREFLDDQFKKVYEKSGSQTQYKDVYQTGQPKAFKGSRINKILDANYLALEKEDMLMFKPTFRKAYAQWCDARGIKNMSEMTEQQMEQAGNYALHKAEYATFRDDSTFARKICGYKTKSAGRKGKTALGTAGYRAANMAIEGHLPFVKTPVNILRRSIDYSPLGIAKGISKLAKTESAEMFKEGIHEICSGMTGTGVAMFGALLASQGVITTDAKNAKLYKDENGEWVTSGDAYFNRDLGYQDYSLTIGPGDHKYSLSIDWASPMQTALFMGAAMHDKLEADGFDMQDIMDIGVKVFNPMLDMSFMSTSKDTFDSFMDKVYRNGTGDDADWTGAITQTLFGKVPQGYLGSLVPQMLSQAATGSDKYQRDTRSTKEDAVAASWESWGRQIANKIPVLRQTVNNPKVDRYGNKKMNTGGNNIVTRYLNSMLNPSNVKRITTNDMDKELISIFNKIPEGTTQKKYFFYDFTGNPDYELANGKRMTYDELYKYGKTKRQSQSDSIQNMFDAKSYKNMSNSLKVDEIVKYKKDISTIQADAEVYGMKYTIEKIVGGENVADDERKGGKADATAWKILKNMGGSVKEKRSDFVNFWIEKEKLMARAHDTGYETKALACAITGNKELGRAYDINTDKIDRAFSYIEEKGKKAGYDMFTDASCNIMAGLDKAQVESTSKANRSWSAAGYKIDESTYRAMGFDWNSAQSGAGLRQKYGYDVNQLLQMASDAKYNFDADSNGSLKKAEVVAYIDSLGIDDTQHKACLFEYLSGGGVKNPYDSINDYLKWGEDSRDGSSSGGRGWGRGRRGWGHRRGGGGGSGSGTNASSWDDYVADLLADSSKKKSSKVKTKDNTHKSEINEAYIRRARKKQMAYKRS